MCRLTDKLCLYLKVKTFKHSATGAWKRYFVNDLMTTSWLRPAKSAVSLSLTAQNRYRESQTSHSGDIFQLVSVGVSIVLEHTERAVRARGDCPIVNRSQMVSLSWVDKKKV